MTNVLPNRAQPFPNLAHDVISAQVIKVGRSGSYDFHLFSFGERGSSLTPALTNEIREGLLDQAKQLDKTYDSIIAVQPAGAMWALLMAYDLNVPLKVITVERSSPRVQKVVSYLGGYHGRRVLYLPALKPQERVLLIDDVISTGATVSAIASCLAQQNASLAGVLSIVDKIGEGRKLEAELGVPVRSILSLSLAPSAGTHRNS